jgi:hypothetical protein
MAASSVHKLCSALVLLALLLQPLPSVVAGDQSDFQA